MNSKVIAPIAASLLLAVLCPDVTQAQCSGQWLPGAGFPGTSGTVSAVAMWDPDDAGPLPAAPVVGGTFTIAGKTFVSNIARWNTTTSTWVPLGTGTNGAVSALTVFNGDLIAGGAFTLAGGVAGTSNIARWDAATNAWAPLGTGANGNVNALLVSGSALIAGGAFTLADNVTDTSRIASWNGATWSAMGSGMSNIVNALATYNGNIIAGGTFTAALGATPAANRIVQWDGSAWTALAGGMSNTVSALGAYGDKLIASGSFTGTYVRVAQWDGSAWNAMSGGLTAQGANALGAANGVLVLAGGFTTAGGFSANRVAEWDGSFWSALDAGGGLDQTVSAMVVWHNDISGLDEIIVGGAFSSAGGVPATRVARYDGSAWHAYGSGTNQSLSALRRLANGDVLAAGTFTSIEGVEASSIARWNGSSWSTLGGVFTGSGNGAVTSLCELSSGEIVVGGNFTAIDGATMNHIARWNGASWTPFVDTAAANGVSSTVNAIVELVAPSAVGNLGDVIVGGNFSGANAVGSVTANRVARWTPSTNTWSILGTGTGTTNGTAGNVNSLLILPTTSPTGDAGDLIVGGAFSKAGNITGTSRIARWDGSAWLPVNSVGLSNTVFSLAWYAGALVAGGSFTDVGGGSGGLLPRIASSDGTSWTAIGGGTDSNVTATAEMSNGDLIAVGYFVNAGGSSANRIARWNGASWAALGTGLDADTPVGTDQASAVAITGAGVIMVGGTTLTAGGAPSAYLARWADCVGACCEPDGSCLLAAPGSPSATCASGSLVINETCMPNTCPQPASGVCCRGATCNVLISQANCTAVTPAGAVFASSSSTCNSGGSTTSPCCYPDFNKTGGITVGDIFDFLNSWFAGDLSAHVGGDGDSGALAVQDIFNFLNAWFAGGC